MMALEPCVWTSTAPQREDLPNGGAVESDRAWYWVRIRHHKDGPWLPARAVEVFYGCPLDYWGRLRDAGLYCNG